MLHREPPAKVERYRTSEGQEFVIIRRPHRGRRYQEPRPTGNRVACPYCSQEHDLVYYLVTKGRQSERKLRTWVCPKVGKLPLNHGKKWDDYVESIIVKCGSEAEQSTRHEAQTSERDSDTRSQPMSIEEMLEKMYSDIDWSSIQEKEPKEEVKPVLQTSRSLAEFPACALVRPVGTRKVRRDLLNSYSSAVKRFTNKSPPSLDRIADRYVSAKATKRVRGCRPSQHIVSPKKLCKFRAS